MKASIRPVTDAQGITIYHGDVTMPYEGYELWGADDKFVAEFVAGKLGATILEILSYRGFPADTVVV
jgi:hypothetical protein